MNSWGRRRQRRPARSWSMGPILARRRLGAGVDDIRGLSDSAGDALFDPCGRDRAVVQARLTRVRTQPIWSRTPSGPGGAPIFIHRPRTGSGRWSWYGLVSLPLMVRGVLPPGIQDAR